MKLDEYQIAIKRTCPDLYPETNNIGINLSHMALGIVSELSEIEKAAKEDDAVGVSEELADVYWYLGNWCNLRQYKLSDFEKLTVPVSELEYTVIYYIAELADIAKKALAYKKDINVDLERTYIIGLLSHMVGFSDEFEINVDKILENNINKLLVRFPLEEGFTEEAAKNRNTNLERIELEK